VPSSVMGTTAAPSLAATVNAPFLNSAILPVADRVPCVGKMASAPRAQMVALQRRASGKNSTGVLWRSSSRHLFRHSCACHAVRRA
jgi:hypothetical protein